MCKYCVQIVLGKLYYNNDAKVKDSLKNSLLTGFLYTYQVLGKIEFTE